MNKFDAPLGISKEKLLANQLAIRLKDIENVNLYENFCQVYTSQSLTETLGKVEAFPDDKIRKTKGALFTYLIKRYGKKQSQREIR
ncbi:hypothetical protein COB64_03865 [Candidatus Wolfebacteria bacterium]|nr:MAG: hypothetical protein COB64_03865 [Candidatus Wolfebacteria bacterium]